MEYFVNASMSGLSNFSSKLRPSNNTLADVYKSEISQNKQISNEFVEFDVHFKDFQTKLLFSKPEQDCVEGTNALIFGQFQCLFVFQLTITAYYIFICFSSINNGFCQFEERN